MSTKLRVRMTQLCEEIVGRVALSFVLGSLVLSCSGAKLTAPLVHPERHQRFASDPAERHSETTTPPCDPTSLLAEARPHFEALAPDTEPKLRMLEDINGDGRHDFAIEYPNSMTSISTMVYATTGNTSCYAEVYNGSGSVSLGGNKHSNGWRVLDIELNPYFRVRGFASVLAEYDGERYRLVRVENCVTPTDPQPSADECAEVLEGYAPP